MGQRRDIVNQFYSWQPRSLHRVGAFLPRGSHRQGRDQGPFTGRVETRGLSQAGEGSGASHRQGRDQGPHTGRGGTKGHTQKWEGPGASRRNGMVREEVTKFLSLKCLT